MVKTVIFTKRTYPVVYLGISGYRGEREEEDRWRRQVKLRKALATLGEIDPAVPVHPTMGDVSRILKGDTATLDLEQSDIDMLKQMLKSINWSMAEKELLLDFFDALSDAKQVTE